MLGLAKRLRIPILQASTSEVYGDPKVTPQNEDYWGHVNPIGLRACYDEGKRAAESLFFDYQRQYGLSVKVARIFNTYGPRMSLDDGRLISNLILQALRGEDLTIFGDGTQTRSFCYVSDLVSGLIRFMDTPNFSGPVNLGNEYEITINEIAEIILKKIRSSSRIKYLELPIDDPKQRRPDTSKAKSLLNWEAKTTLDEGLNATIKYFNTRI
jgi:UDP-glucuronate decarboxylase